MAYFHHPENDNEMEISVIIQIYYYISNEPTDSDDEDEDVEEHDDDDDDDDLCFRYRLGACCRSLPLFRRPSDVDSAADDVAMADDTDPRLKTADFDLDTEFSLSMKNKF